MDLSNITKELCDFVNANLLDQSISIDEDIEFKELGIDSVSIIQIVLFIERKYGVSMSEKDLTPNNLSSIKSLANFTLQNL